MKLYTVFHNGKEKLAAEASGGKLYGLNELGAEASDMNELIDDWETIGEQLRKKLAEINADENAFADKILKDYQILAPIPRPKQDVVCLGVNYFDHMKEAAAGIDFVKKAETIYFSKRVSRANDPDGLIPMYDFVDSLDY